MKKIKEEKNIEILVNIRYENKGKELIQTSSVPRGRMIKGRWYENTGLKRKHVRQAIRMLNRM